MPGSFLFIGLVLGLDSFLVSVPLGAMDLSRSRRRRLALSFAVCDGLATGVGGFLPLAGIRTFHAEPSWIVPALVAGYGLYVLLLGWRTSAAVSRGRSGMLAFALPLLLSLDNIVSSSGAGGGVRESVGNAVAVGAVSGGMSLLGLMCGAATIGRMFAAPFRLAGCLFLLASAAVFCVDTLR